MDEKAARREIEALLDEWQRSIAEGDSAAAARLRASDYAMTLPDGSVLAGDAEIAWLLSRDAPRQAATVRSIEIGEGGDRAELVADIAARSDYNSADSVFCWKVSLRKSDGAWRARSSVVELRGEEEPGPAPDAGNGLAGPARRLASGLRRLVAGRAPAFQDLAYQPYRPGEDYILPLAGAADPGAEPGALPIPPRSLWLGYNYPAHGAEHVGRMLDIVQASGFAIGEGERILDFGCGAGRLIRHLAHLADRCEIWGTDISAEHINWCRRHLRPPFHFATTTKVPHLPFEDRSFGLIYCGSVFTHIDDLADAWLLELHRILRPDGRLYLTLHDEHTIGLFGEEPYRRADYVRKMVAQETFRTAVRDGFGMFTVDRDEESQVFYDSRFFERMARPMFDIVSLTPEAYFYQSGYLLKRKGGPQ